MTIGIRCHTRDTFSRHLHRFPGLPLHGMAPAIDMRIAPRDRRGRAPALLSQAAPVWRATQLPRAATWLLAVALGATCIQESYQIYGVFRGGAAEPGGALQRVHTASRIDVGAIVGAHLFGVPPPSAGAQSGADEHAAFVLTGIVATSDPAVGYALLGPSGRPASFHAAGTAIAEGVVLRRVYLDRVELERAGGIETLVLPRRAPAGISLAQFASASTAEPELAPTPDPQTIASRIAAESDRLAAVVQLEPLMSGDRLRGIVVEPGATPAMLAQLGLKPGDVIHHVDGILITEPDRLDFLRKALATGKPVRVSVTRPGEAAQDITLDGAAVAGMLSQ